MGPPEEDEFKDEPPISEILEAEKGVEEREKLKEINSAYRLNESAEEMSARLQQYHVFGVGNISGRSQDAVEPYFNPLVTRIQSVMGGTSYSGALRNGQGYQFSGEGGREGASESFRMLSGRLPSGNADTFRDSIGDTDVTVNIHTSSGQGGDPAYRGATTIEIRTKTMITGSHIPVQTFVKIRYPDPEPQPRRNENGDLPE